MKRIIFFMLILPAVVFSRVWANELKKVSGDNQTALLGYPIKNELVVKAVDKLGNPISGKKITFSVISGSCYGPDAQGNAAYSKTVYSKKNGLVSLRPELSAVKEGKVIVYVSSRDSSLSPAVFTISVKTRNWMLKLILGIIGGLGLFLFGMFYLNEALQKIAGNKLRDFLSSLSSSVPKGIGTGFFVTLLNQSSSATTVLEVSLVSAGLLTFLQSVPITMGAEIGSTMTGQLLAFKVADYAVLIAGLGFYFKILGSGKKWKRFGETLIGFGLIFMGMKIMSDLMLPLRDYPPFMDMMKSIDNPVSGIFFGLIFTMLIQSSGATAGIVIAMAISGTISLKQAVAFNLGAQAGTCITAIISSWGRNREGRKVALWHLMHQSFGVVILYPLISFITYKGEPVWIYFVVWFTKNLLVTQDLARQIATAHTLSSIVNVIIFIPLIPVVYKLMEYLFPVREDDKPFGPKYLDDEFISTPSLALSQVKKEIVREGIIVYEMFRDVIKVFANRDMDLCDSIPLKEIRTDILQNAIVPYITKISQGYLSEAQSENAKRLLYAANDIESIGDLIDKQIIPLAHKKLENKMWFSDEGWRDIVSIHREIEDNFNKIITALETNNTETAQLVIKKKPEIDNYESELFKRHIQRLNSGLKESIETSNVHLDIISLFRAINSHVTSIARSIMGYI